MWTSLGDLFAFVGAVAAAAVVAYGAWLWLDELDHQAHEPREKPETKVAPRAPRVAGQKADERRSEEQSDVRAAH